MRLEWKPSRWLAERAKNAWELGGDGSVKAAVKMCRKIDQNAQVTERGRRQIVDFSDGSRLEVWRSRKIRMIEFSPDEARRERVLQANPELFKKPQDQTIRGRGANTPAPPIPWIKVEEL